jgi:uncharacterized membrane protein YdjX (TVP38/TMEM64 family)
MTGTSQTTPATSGGGLPWAKIAIGIVALVALVFAYRLLPISQWVEAFRLWVENLGVLGWIIFMVVYALTTFMLVPGSILTLAAGVAFGLWGFPLVVVGATFGSAISFLAARYIFHDRVQEKVVAYPKFNAVNQAIGEEGWRVVLLLRLSPALPFSLQNWFLGLTPVGFWPAQLATFLGIMPGTLLYVWIGSLGGQAAAGGGDASALKYAVFGAGIIATLIVTVLVTKKAKAKLAQIQDKAV